MNVPNRLLKSIQLLFLLVPALLPVRAQTSVASEPGMLYGGIEVGSKGIKATAIRVSENEEGYSVKLIYAEVVNTTVMQLKDNKFAPEVVRDTVAAVGRLMARMKDEYKVPLERINVIGSSGLRADNPEDLINAVREKTGKSLTFLDVESEVQLSIVGTIPQRYRTRNGTWADNRGISMLLDVGSGNTKGGYQVIRQIPTGDADYDYVTVGIPKGTVSFTNEINQAAGESADLPAFARKAKELSPVSVRAALRKEMERKPGLVNRQRVYLTGGIVWAMATLLHPEDRRTFVPITSEEIDMFYRLVTSDAQSLQKLLNPNLTRRISNPQTRLEAEKEIESVRNAFSPRNLIAGAEILKAVKNDFNLTGKRVRFARYGYLSWILSYVRLQATEPNP
ncbi:MAG TPA: hypothetical protein PLD20_19515 [Blastocatellia bacterium]|nr:hypothetical protein [Blastocatellia bacterium]HMV82455.1 hypothetical protein [Blastocatellia bacterium]HMY74050.1 hypothetical protein [Blastocatellia bacterium]HMZ20136.1 hypothetical protein [Blastocatellia bacterium]HNG31126.1 hypothetical protein [Blastocatellia bacterium]